MNLEEVLNFRRAVKVYDLQKPADNDKVKHCLEMAALAPSSSNMQLWEFYHITDKKIMAKLSKACLDQASTATASQIVVFVTRQDLHQKRAKAVLHFEKGNIERNSPKEKQAKRIRERKLYYNFIMPFQYARFVNLIGWLRMAVVNLVGIFRPIVYETSECDVRVVTHKSCALAAQTFMIAMANEGYDTCPIEGFDSRMIKKILKLPCGAEINMVIPCGIRKGKESIWGERFRVPFEEVYRRI